MMTTKQQGFAPGALDDAQREAVTSTERALLVLAGPGSGKTHTITQRIFYLVEELGVPPEEILVITFTKDAAQSMQRRFADSSGGVSPVNFGTFHSVFYHILRTSRKGSDLSLLTDRTRKKILGDLLAASSSGRGIDARIPKERAQGEEASGRSGHSRGESARMGAPSRELAGAFAEAISFYKNTDDEDGAKQKLPQEARGLFPEIFARYEGLRRRKGLIDFDDMVCDCRELLRRDPEARAYWSGRFKHILMDEFQDINPVQYEVVKLLAGMGGGPAAGGGARERGAAVSLRACLFAVGDDDQSIYGFRGSEPKCLERYERETGAKRVYLDRNYRSLSGIVEASSLVIAKNRQRYEKRFTAVRDLQGNSEGIKKTREERAEREGGSVVSIRRFEEEQAQYEALAGELRARQESASKTAPGEAAAGEAVPGKTASGESPCESVAVLFRTNLAMQSCASALGRAGIRFAMREKVTSVYDHFLAQDLMAYLEAAEHLGEAGSAEPLLRIANKPVRYISREALLGGADPIENAVRAYSAPERVPYRAERLEALRTLRRDLQFIRPQSPYLALQYIRRRIGYERYLRGEAKGNPAKWEEYEELLNWICEDARQYESLAEWREAQEAYAESLAPLQAVESAPVQLMTVHASKGLEFDRVYLPSCNEGQYPHGRMPDPKTVEEECRIFYVAMTRARDSLALWYLTGTKERPRQPSRFLKPLMEKERSLRKSPFSRRG